MSSSANLASPIAAIATFDEYIHWYLLCPECRESEAGREYKGTANTTVTGKQCQAWSSNTTHVPDPDFTDDKFPDGSREAAENYCRNPDESYTRGVWCYTMDPGETRELCDVPLCSKFGAIEFWTASVSSPEGADNARQETAGHDIDGRIYGMILRDET